MSKTKITAEDITKNLDLTDKTIVITGVSSGIGYETMRVLAMRGAHIIAVGRSLEKVKNAGSNEKITPLYCDLTDLNSVKQCAEQIIALKIPIDVLICNAGIMALHKLTVKDGLELQFFTNYMAHFLLTYLLMDAICAAKKGRIVMVTGEAFRSTVKGGIDFNNLDGSKGYSPWRFYGQSKLANLLAAVSFNERFKAFGVTANSVHPGIISTNLMRNMGGILGWLLRSSLATWLIGRLYQTVEEGAAAQCFVAVHPDTAEIGGAYFLGTQLARPSYYGRSKELADQLWDFSLAYLQPYLTNTPIKT
ncbi:MAG TPA: SDR family oxidoreductase [Pseudomonadales bacterium]|nr:SDR family oxidoreductase [Pseudomonadales bacterium]